MGIFDKIKGAIFGRATASDMPAGQQSASPKPNVVIGSAAAIPAAPAAPAAPVPSAPNSPQAEIDVSAILDQAVKATGQKLNWKTSIVDLMKALDLDSSLSARKELAKELNYAGDTGDSAKMNAWLHKALMQNLAENGGKIPDDLKN
ncbi:DUF3597 domain-containing protein [Mesorhizobium sp. A623]